MTLRSDLPLGGLPAGDTLNTTNAEIAMHRQDVPKIFPNALSASPLVQISVDGSVLITPAGIGRFLVSADATNVSYHRDHEATDDAIASIMLSIVAGAVLHKRNVVPLHASCVVLSQRAIAIAGASGSGKSSLALHLMQRGAELLAEDVTPLRLETCVWTAQGATSLRLLPDSISSLGEEAQHWRRVQSGGRKFVRHLPSVVSPPRKLAAIVRLNRVACGMPASIEALQGKDRIASLPDLIYRWPLGRRLRSHEALFHDVTQLSNAVPFFRLNAPDDLKQISCIAARLEELAATLN